MRRLFDLQQNKKRFSRLFRVKSMDYGGLRVCTDPDYLDKGIIKALYKRSYEREEFSLVRKHLNPEDRVLEVGAGIGVISTLCASICGSSSVISYEANPALERVIRRNYEINAVTPNLKMKALAHEAGEITFYFHHNFYSSSLMPRENGVAATVQCDAINEVITNHQCTALIMDVEGAEIDLLPVADLTGVSKIIVELHPHIVGDMATVTLLQHMETRGFMQLEKAGPVVVLMRKNSS